MGGVPRDIDDWDRGDEKDMDVQYAFTFDQLAGYRWASFFSLTAPSLQ